MQPTTFPELIKKVRKLKHLTQRDFGRLLNPPVAQPTVARWEKGEQLPDRKYFPKLHLYAPIEQLLRDSVNPANFANGIELWVTVFPALKIPGLGYDWLIDFVRAKTGTDAHWLCVQDFRDTETIYNLLLASAAIPLAFPSRKVNGKAYVDGALADNVPLKALAARGCTHAIVIHLCNGAVWSRHDFPEQTIIEIRPEKTINSSDNLFLGSISSLLNFKSDRIYELQQQGYNDAERCLKPIIQTLITTKNQRLTNDALVNSTQSLLEDLPL